MGGEPWKISSPWQSDMAKVLDETRQRVFRDRLYDPLPGRTFETLDALDAFFTEEPDDDDVEDFLMEGAAGTRSILDIRAVGSEITPGATAPLPDSDLIELFGSSQPTAGDLTEDGESEIYARLTRGDSIYVVVYANGKPSEVAFYGYSWD